ncbi:TPA: hypothetical protein U1B13_000545 [Streptococcus suis]|nr:hypothetical protein [Streptococcus suis]
MKGNLTRSDRREEERIRKMNSSCSSLTERQKFVLHGYSLLTGFPLLVSMLPKLPSLIRFIFTEDMEIADTVVYSDGTALGTLIRFISQALFYFSFMATLCFTAALIFVATIGGKNYTDSEYKEAVMVCTTTFFIITLIVALSY